MPEKDVLGTTEFIIHEYPVPVRSKIIAMTANAMQNDKEKYFLFNNLSKRKK